MTPPVACSWCRKGEGGHCNCVVDCHHADCPRALADNNPLSFDARRVAMPVFHA